MTLLKKLLPLIGIGAWQADTDTQTDELTNIRLEGTLKNNTVRLGVAGLVQDERDHLAIILSCNFLVVSGNWTDEHDHLAWTVAVVHSLFRTNFLELRQLVKCRYSRRKLCEMSAIEIHCLYHWSPFVLQQCFWIRIFRNLVKITFLGLLRGTYMAMHETERVMFVKIFARLATSQDFHAKLTPIMLVS